MSDGFGDRMKAARRTAGIEQKELAILMGISVGTISRWERGITVPSAAERRMLADNLRTTVSWLETGDADFFPGASPIFPEAPEPQGAEPRLKTGSEKQGSAHLIRVPYLSDPWRMLDEIILARGLRVTEEEHEKIVILAASKAILENRDPIRKDVLEALSAILDQQP